MQAPHHLKAIDQLRGVAILLVLANHTFGYAKVKFPMPFANGSHLSLSDSLGFSFMAIFANGFLGVMLFFVLSGFCIRWSHINSRALSWPDFYKRRFFRIFPAYWFWLIVAASVTGASVWDFFSHAVLSHNLIGDYFHSIYAPFWSIAIEWQIYLLYPLVIWITSKFNPRIVLIAFAIIGVLSSLISSNYVSSILGTDFLKIFGKLPTALMFSWMLGFYMAESMKTGQPIKSSLWLLFASLIAGILAYSHPNSCFLASIPWSYAAYQIAALFLSQGHRQIFRMFDWLAWIGIVSYSVYLSHDLFHMAYSPLSEYLSLPLNVWTSGLVSFLVMVFPMLLVGYLSYRLIEMPGIRIGKKFRGKSISTNQEAQQDAT